MKSVCSKYCFLGGTNSSACTTYLPSKPGGCTSGEFPSPILTQCMEDVRLFCLHKDARDWSIFHNHADGTKFLHHQWYNIKKTELPNYYDLKRCNLCFIVLGPPRSCHLQAYQISPPSLPVINWLPKLSG